MVGNAAQTEDRMNSLRVFQSERGSLQSPRDAGPADGLNVESTAAPILFFYDRCSSAANLGNLISGRDAHAVIVRYGERREYCPVADCKLLKDVMEVHLDGAVDNIQPAPNFLVRQSLGHQTHDLALALCQNRQHVLRIRLPLLPRYGLIREGQRQ